MPFTKVMLSPVTKRVRFVELKRPFTDHKITPKSIYTSYHKESSFYQYSEGFVIVELENQHDALVVWDAIQNGEIEFTGQNFSVAQLFNDYSPIGKLPDHCLMRIFSMLPVSKSVDIEKVCKRWKTVIPQCSYSDTKIDTRDSATFEDAKKCIVRYGSNLKEVYYNINSSVSLLAKYCDNLKNLTIDYEKDQRFRDGRDVQRRLTWHQFKCLSRVTLINMWNTKCYFLHYLPETVIELQLLNSSDFYSQRYLSLVDLSHLPNLRSLKLKGFEFTDGLLVEFDELNNLKHLFIENCELSEKHQADFSRIDSLEYLTVRDLFKANKDNWQDIFENSKNLTYVEISGVRENPFWPPPSSKALRQLKYLRVTDVELDEFDETIENGFPRLEYLDCQHSRKITDDELCEIVEVSPKLKFLDARGCRLTSNIVKRIRSIKVQQTNKVLLKIFVGNCGWYKHKCPTYYSKYFVVDKMPREDEKIPDVNEGWFTKDCEIIKRVSVMLPVLDDSSPIETLPTECLGMIFSHLTFDDRLIAEEVCQWWKAIILTIWKNHRKFDVRDLRYSEDAKKCVERCGQRLEEIYCYKDHELSVIAECCSNVRKVTIDFQERMCDQGNRRGEPDFPDLKPTLVQLKRLTHLTLKNIDEDHDFDFLKDLPETMIEIHIFSEDEATEADVSKFFNLHALTLNNFRYEAIGSIEPVRGFEKLETLRYLRLESLSIISYSINTLRNLRNLEYFSLRDTTRFGDRDIVSVLENNKNLKYLNLSGFSSLTNPVLNATSNLQNLKTLCLDRPRNEADSDEDDYDNDDDRCLDQLRGIPSLEYFEYGMSSIIKQDVLMSMISMSPNLKLVTIESNKYKAEKIIAAANKAVLYRTNNNPLLVIALGERVKLVRRKAVYSSHVVTCDKLDAEDAMVFEIKSNERYTTSGNDWYVKSSDEDSESDEDEDDDNEDNDDEKSLNEEDL